MKTGKAFSLIALLVLLLTTAVPAYGQRRITPVQPKPGTIPTVKVEEPAFTGQSNLAERRDAQGNIVLVDTVTGTEWVDTTLVNRKAKMLYPLLESVSIGVDIWDPAMRIFGQHYGLIGFWGELSLHNRYKPVFELGFGQCDDTPDDRNFTFHVPVSPYFKIGLNYNIFYNNSPDYQFNVGLRYGFTPFKWSVTAGTISDGYWQENTAASIPSQSATAGYFEFTAGVKVKIWRWLSMGWTARYHALLHEGKSAFGEPMYIPGYGKRSSHFTGSFSIIYTLPLNKKRPGGVNTSEGGADTGTRP